MWAFICQYWLEFLFGAIAIGIGALAKHYYNLVKLGRATNKEKEKQPIFEEIKKLREDMKSNNDAFKNDLKECHCALKSEIQKQNAAQEKKMEDSHRGISEQLDNLVVEIEKNNQATDAVRLGTLALWRKTYFNDARRLLENDHIITHEEFVKITTEHDIYNKLGGNHEGDQYFESIRKKYESGLVQNPKNG